ncbi:MAG: hypothetical protein H6Q62_330 [Firmicutes bacterium]|nr:hypothetical protein [Bacillota bacterium]
MRSDEQLQYSTLKRHYDELTQTLRSYEKLFQEAPVAYVLLDDNLRITRFNIKAGELFDTKDLKDKPLIQFVQRSDRDEMVCHFDDLRQRQFMTTCSLIFLISGNHKHFKLFSEVIDDGTNNKFCCAIIDETQDILYHKQIEELNNYDSLTGLYNRRYFGQRLMALREEGQYPIGVIVADLNGLKLVNDAFGHATGDQMIQQAASTMSSVLGPGAVIARVGGDEFAILAPGLDSDAMRKLVLRLENATRQLTVGFLNMTLAFGSSVIEDREQDSTAVFVEAETRMFRNKLNTAPSQRHILISSLLSTLHHKMPGEARHSECVGQFMLAFSKAMNFDNAKCLKLRTAGLMHDIGKIAIDHTLIVKSSAMRKSDHAELEKHPEIGFRILASTTTFADIAEIVLNHHERLDGKGYPRQLSEAYISEETRMLSICECYDAMISGRSYKKALSKADAIAELRKNSGSQFDARLVQIFVEKVLQIEE